MIMRKCKKGSLTIEAAAVLPLFITGLLTLVSLLFMQRTAMRIQASLLNTAKILAVECANGHNVALSEVRDELSYDLGEKDLRFVENGMDGLDLTGSCLDDPDYIELDLRCRLVPLTGYFGMIGIPYERRCLAHIWCGYDRAFFEDEEYVYVTDDSDVYHCDRECSHIRLTVMETTAEQIKDLRNDNGARYKPCAYCHASLSDKKLYITPEGDRFHNSLTCSGLKRTVRAIKKSEAGDRRPCSRCGR